MFGTCSYRIASSLKIYNKYSTNGLKLLAAINHNTIQQNNVKYLSAIPSKHTLKTTDDGFLKRLVKKIPFFDINKSKLKVSGYLLYELVADQVNYEEFFKKYPIPDTFYSWFAITELHIWMLSVRAMAEGDDGRYMRNCIIQALWADVNTRAKKLGAANPAEIRAQVNELSEQFYAALIAYDEGLLSSDTALAGALWRRVFQHQCDNPQHLDSLVLYVRKQIKMLDQLSRKEFMEQRQIKWLLLQNR